MEELYERVEELPDRVLLYTDQGERLVALLGEVEHESVLVRRSTLEERVLALDRPARWWTDGPHCGGPQHKAGGGVLAIDLSPELEGLDSHQLSESGLVLGPPWGWVWAPLVDAEVGSGRDLGRA